MSDDPDLDEYDDDPEDDEGEDVNVLAKSIVDRSTGADEEE